MPHPEDLVTIAVNVTELPNRDGFGEAVSTVVVATVELVTTWVMTLEVLVVKLVLSLGVYKASK